MRFSRLLQVASLSVSLLGVFAYLTCIGTPMAQAQADLGSVSGTVTDASGAVVPNASITLTNIANGAQRVSTTNAQGDYAITQLPPTEYRIMVSAAGFTSSHQNFTLAIGATRTIHVRLNVSGGQTEIVVSTENTTTPDVADAQISTQITTSQVENMPLQDRNPYNLVNLSGNVSGQITGGDRGVGVDIGGARSASVDILMDGAENTDLFGVGVGQSIPQDAMQEFSVVVAGQGAEFGRASGGAVNVGTKSGTNQFHGDAYEYNRISTFASDSFQNNAYWAAPDHNGLSSPKPRYVHNQFGYFVGGPIKKNKLFFSSATEWTRVRSSLFSTAEVPLPGLISMSASNMQDFFSAYGTLQYPVNSETYTGAQTQNLGLWAYTDPKNVGDISNIALTQTGATSTTDNPVKSCADPRISAAPICTTPIFGTVIYPVAGDSGGGTPVNQWINFDRVDWTVSDRTQLFGRYVQQSSDFFSGTNASSPYKGFNTGSSQANHNLLLSLTHTFSQNVASATKVLATRFNNLQPLNGDPTPTLYPNSSATVGLGAGHHQLPGLPADFAGFCDSVRWSAELYPDWRRPHLDQGKAHLQVRRRVPLHQGQSRFRRL